MASGAWASGAWRNAHLDRALRHRFGLVKTKRSSPSGSVFGSFTRGFVEEYYLSSAASANGLTRFRESEPLPSMVVSQYHSANALRTPAIIAALADAPRLTLPATPHLLSQLRGTVFACHHLTLRLDPSTDEPFDFSCEGLEFPKLRNLRIDGLDRNYVSLDDDGLTALLRRFGPSLISLDLAGLEEGEARFDWPAGLERLCLEDPEAVERLMERDNLPAVDRLEVATGVRFPSHGSEPLILARPDWAGAAGVRHLNASGWFDAAGDSRFLDQAARAFPNLESLEVWINARDGYVPVARAIPPRLERLQLQFISNPPRQEVARQFAEMACRVDSLEVTNPPPEFFSGPEWQQPSALTKLKICYHEAAKVEQLADIPALAGLEVLDIINALKPPTARTIHALARAPFARNLKALTLDCDAPNHALYAAAERHFGPRCDIYWTGES